MALLNKRWNGTTFKTGATFRRWNGSTWKTGATVRVWTGSAWLPTDFKATGGTKFTVGEYTYHAFTNVGNNRLEVIGSGRKIEWLIMGGGGAGSNYLGGGGSGTLNILPESAGYKLGAGIYNVFVGAGGNGAVPTYLEPNNGENSFIQGIPNALAKGGGAGARTIDVSGSVGGSSGGSGFTRVAPIDVTPNGGGVLTYAGVGTASTKSMGTNYNGVEEYTYGGNGGGTSGSIHGIVPIGHWWKNSTTPFSFIGGGGAGLSRSPSHSRSGSGGLGGGGSSSTPITNGTGYPYGLPNTGSGGAGGYQVGHGGSGVVYIRYKTK